MHNYSAKPQSPPVRQRCILSCYYFDSCLRPLVKGYKPF